MAGAAFSLWTLGTRESPGGADSGCLTRSWVAGTCVNSVPLCVKNAVSAALSVRRRLSPSTSFVRWGAPR